MPIPNVSTLYQKIHKGSEGGSEFARFVKLLLTTEYESRGETFISESDASGDYKRVDGYVIGNDKFPDNIIGFQYKFYPAKLSSQQKTEIEKSIDNAIQANRIMKEFILITPEDFQKEEQRWFDEIRQKYDADFYHHFDEGSLRIRRKMTHWGHTKLIGLALRHQHIGIHYFPELFPVGVGALKLSDVSIDTQVCDWKPIMDSKFGYWQRPNDNSTSLIEDPIFDFVFTNNSNETFLLKKIGVEIVAIRIKLKGLPEEYFLRSVGTIDIRVDFNRPVTELEFSDPMMFQYGKPMRFKICLLDFTKKCPGNTAEIKFWFHFNNDIVIPTATYLLDFV